jgi:hypothetical protein
MVHIFCVLPKDILASAHKCNDLMNDYIIELPELFNVSNNKSMIMFIKGFVISVLELNQK